jgi:hypothetical protein
MDKAVATEMYFLTVLAATSLHSRYEWVIFLPSWEEPLLDLPQFTSGNLWNSSVCQYITSLSASIFSLFFFLSVGFESPSFCKNTSHWIGALPNLQDLILTWLYLQSPFQIVWDYKVRYQHSSLKEHSP